MPFVRYDVIPLPADTPPSPGEPTNYDDSRQAVVLRMRYKFGTDSASFHFFFSFRRENIYTRLSSLSLSVSYAFIHAFQVSSRGAPCHFSVCSSPRHGTRMSAPLILFPFHNRWQTGRLRRPLRL